MESSKEDFFLVFLFIEYKGGEAVSGSRVTNSRRCSQRVDLVSVFLISCFKSQRNLAITKTQNDVAGNE